MAGQGWWGFAPAKGAALWEDVSCCQGSGEGGEHLPLGKQWKAEGMSEAELVHFCNSPGQDSSIYYYFAIQLMKLPVNFVVLLLLVNL